MRGEKGNKPALDRIRVLLDATAGQVSAYQPNRRLAEAELRAWEGEHGVVLPEEYRQFLRDVGDGGWMPGSYCDFIIEPLAEVRGGRSAATPFPVSIDRLRTRLRELKAKGRPSEGVLFPELEVFWQEDAPPPGCLEFGQYPSADTLFLVTAGDLRGSVWCKVSAGVPELGRDRETVGFLDWFADVLAELQGEA
jgi:hypothetical protein